MTELAFLVLISLVLYVYFGYPAILSVVSLAAGEDSSPPDGQLPSVTLFIPAYNEEKVICSKIDNALALNYRKDRLQIVVASDASNDGTDDIVAGYRDKGVRLFPSPVRAGKNAMINMYLGECLGDIIVFTDANSFYEKDCICRLAKHFLNPRVGCVVGRLKYIDEQSSVGKGEGLYFRYESLLKGLESRLGTVVAATGSVYAIRKDLFKPLDPDVANDFAHPIQIADAGHRIVFESEGVAYEKATSSTAEEFLRRSRIVTRGMTAFTRYWRRHHMLRGLWGFCFVSHKLLRWFVPVFLIMVFLVNLAMVRGYYTYTLFGQIAFYLMALVGLIQNEKKNKFLTVPFYFCMINLAALYGVFRFFVGDRQVIWEKAKTTR
jgi:cellulose synthase/poly-beta-1,6-N-acetylglucosamine synthase-like glycosyltransferase